MRVTIVGAGTLGRVLGVRLARVGVEVSFVVRKPLSDTIVIERVDSNERLELDAVVQSTQHPPNADVVLVCLPAEAMTDAVLEQLAGVAAPVVTLLPLLPQSWARISEALGDRVSAGVPGITGYVRDDDVVRYWLPRVASTSIDGSDDLQPLIAMLNKAGIPAEFVAGVARSNQVVTATLLPMAMGLAARHTIGAALDDDAFVTLVLDAMVESGRLAADLGAPPTWLGLLAKFIGPRMLKVGVGIAERSAKESLHYVEVHFGQSRVESTRALANELLSVCRERGMTTTSLAELVTRIP
jgi:ketopantoate reductase